MVYAMRLNSGVIGVSIRCLVLYQYDCAVLLVDSGNSVRSSSLLDTAVGFGELPIDSNPTFSRSTNFSASSFAIRYSVRTPARISHLAVVKP